jgi:GAF domain-containing protein
MVAEGNFAGDGEPAGRSREQALAAAFVMLADTLVDDYDVIELLERLISSCVELLGVTAGGLLLDDQRGSLAVVAASNKLTQMLERFQLESDEGPCLDCVRGGRRVSSNDLAADRERWPRFTAAALESGFTSVFAVPMRLRELTIGGLNLFHSGPLVTTEDDQRLAQAMADVATLGILQQRAALRSSLLTEQLQRALTSRVMVEQAKGVLAERHGVDMELAFDALRRHARNNNLKLAEVAHSVVRGDTDPRAVMMPPGASEPRLRNL